MSAGQTIVNLCLFIFGMAITRPLTVVLHELGHAIPFILFTRTRTTIYVGSYGDPNGSLHFRIGLLEVWFKYNPLLWRMGLCVSATEQIAVNKRIVATLMGPVTSFLFATAVIIPAFVFEVQDWAKFLLCMLFASAMLDLEQNLRYSETVIQLYDGTTTHTDGYTLRQLLTHKRQSRVSQRIEQLYSKNQFTAVVKAVLALKNPSDHFAHLYSIAAYCALCLKDYDQTLALLDTLSRLGSLRAEEYAYRGVAWFEKGEFLEAEHAFQQCINRDPLQVQALFHLGNTCMVLDKYSEAIPIFDRFLAAKPQDALAYCSRGLAKSKIGMKAEGFNDIYDALRIDPNNAYAYRNLGIYHLDQGEADQALQHFLKAREINPATQGLDQLIEAARPS